jgi:hypothetical protein
MGRSLASVTSAVAPEFRQPAQFLHPKTGRRYRVFLKEGAAVIEEFLLDASRKIVYSDLRPVSYAIGSGNHARSFLVQRSGHFYQAPVTYFTQAGRWDMSPGYDVEHYVGFTRRVTADCLFCHAGRVKALNRAGDLFDGRRPFEETAIGCERCHGPGKLHVTQPGKSIVNPAKLEPPARDQVCEQCHLFGAARVPLRAGYEAGGKLGDHLAIYAYDAPKSDSPSVTSHPEEMKQSACWQESNGKLWCGSCHQIHSNVPAIERSSFYRARCFSCHSTEACKRPRQAIGIAHAENDCVACHMPKRQVVESAHVTFTDHRIVRKPQTNRPAPVATDKLKLVVPAELDNPIAATRNLGFAYAQLASSTGRMEFNARAAGLLRPLAGTEAEDAEFWEILGAAHLELGELEKSEEAFRKALEKDSRSAVAHYSLGYLLQRRGNPGEAADAYRSALELDPEKAEALSNLAAAYFELGKDREAMIALDTALRLEPGNLQWRAMKAKREGGSTFAK